MRTPCDGCNRVHRGGRCKPADARSVPMSITFPAHVHRALVASVGWGDRSGYVARAVENALEDS